MGIGNAIVAHFALEWGKPFLFEFFFSIGVVMKSLIRTCLCMALCFSFSVSANQLYGQVVYTITGFTNGLGGTDDSVFAPEVSPGESYVANFLIDASVLDTDPSSERGEYLGAILSSSIEFSGGYSSELNFAGGEITVHTDAAGSGIVMLPADGGAAGIAIYDLNTTFDSDVLFVEEGSQIVGSQSSLAVFHEPTGLIFSFSEVEFGLQGTTGPIQLSVSLGTEVPSAVLGDCDLDGDVTFEDVPAMVEVLLAGTYSVNADCNEDGAVDFDDIPEFVEILMTQ
jgi:hypothetical protein